MLATTRHSTVAIIAILSSALSGVACESPAAPSPADKTPASPDFNFIPDNTGKCALEDGAAIVSAQQSLLAIAAYPAEVASELTLCPTDSGAQIGEEGVEDCAPCADNPLLEYLTAVGAAQAGIEDDDGNLVGSSDSVVAYVNRALGYQYRDLLLSRLPSLDDDSITASFILSQGQRTCGAGAPCDSFEVQHQSLERDCSTITQQLEVELGSSLDDGAEFVTRSGDRPFGFVVPLTEELPSPDVTHATEATAPELTEADAVSCPAAADVHTETQFLQFLACQPGWRVAMDFPKLTVTRNAVGNCAVIEGYVDSRALPEGASDVVDPYDFEDEDNTGYIKVKLRARLLPAVVSAASLVAVTEATEGDAQ